MTQPAAFSQLADAMTDMPANVSDDLYARLRDQFSEEH
jgi:hypothetical protein